MKSKLLTLIIPVSGDIPNLQNLKLSVQKAKEFESEVEIILLFDEKNTKRSYQNWEDISNWIPAYVKSYRRSFSSVGAARNFGLSETTSTWITFTDADDVNYVDNFLSMLHEVNFSESEIAIGEFELVNAKSEENISQEKMILNADSFQLSFGLSLGIWRCAFKLESIEDVRFPDLNMAEDQIFLARYFNLNRRIHISKNVVYKYFVGNAGSLTDKVEQVRKIELAIPISMHLARKTKGPFPQLLDTIAISQILTGIKHGTLQTQLSSCGRLLMFLGDGFFRRAQQRFKILIKIAKR
jgi:hypothetical protein